MIFAMTIDQSRQKPQGIKRQGPNIDDPKTVVQLLADARALDAQLSRQGWRYLWSHYGLQGLITFARRSGWPNCDPDDAVAEALVFESLVAGYDPVSGMFGEYDQETETFHV